MDYIYHADFQDDPDGGYLVTFPDIPEAITGGKNMNEAIENASDCLDAALSGYLAGRKNLPEVKYKGGIPVYLSVLNAAKISVILAFRASGLTKTELGRRLGKDEKEIRRILNPDQATKMQMLERILVVLGKRLALAVEDLPG